LLAAGAFDGLLAAGAFNGSLTAGAFDGLLAAGAFEGLLGTADFTGLRELFGLPEGAAIEARTADKSGSSRPAMLASNASANIGPSASCLK
jgi:predicted lipid-binding transport protein (Tim44 family)